MTHMTTEHRETLNQVVRDGMDKMYSEGFEMAKLRVRSYLIERATWLDREMRNGGNLEYLRLKYEECRYISQVVEEMTPAPPTR